MPKAPEDTFFPKLRDSCRTKILISRRDTAAWRGRRGGGHLTLIRSHTRKQHSLDCGIKAGSLYSVLLSRRFVSNPLSRADRSNRFVKDYSPNKRDCEVCLPDIVSDNLLSRRQIGTPFKTLKRYDRVVVVFFTSI